jgi:hypothetical protein
VLGLFVYLVLALHLFLSARNITTNEYCKRNWDVRSGNPFGKNAYFKNCLKIFGNRAVTNSNPYENIQQRYRKPAKKVEPINMCLSQTSPSMLMPPHMIATNVRTTMPLSPLRTTRIPFSHTEVYTFGVIPMHMHNFKPCHTIY